MAISFSLSLHHSTSKTYSVPRCLETLQAERRKHKRQCCEQALKKGFFVSQPTDDLRSKVEAWMEEHTSSVLAEATAKLKRKLEGADV